MSDLTLLLLQSDGLTSQWVTSTNVAKALPDIVKSLETRAVALPNDSAAWGGEPF